SWTAGEKRRVRRGRSGTRNLRPLVLQRRFPERFPPVVRGHGVGRHGYHNSHTGFLHIDQDLLVLLHALQRDGDPRITANRPSTAMERVIDHTTPAAGRRTKNEIARLRSAKQ